MSSLVPMSLCRSCQNMDVNLVSRSDTIDSGTPWSLMTSLRNSHATSFAVTCIVVGTRCTCDVSQSMITNRESLPRDRGNGPMKFIPTDCHGLSGIGKLCRNPCGFSVLVLLVWHFLHDLQKVCMSVAICGHQYDHQI